MEQSQLLKTGIAAVKEAEKIIMKYYSKSIEVELKGDNTPVTIVDKMAEKVIVDIIKSKFPDHSILGEEYGNGIDSTDSEYLWVVDPIDGTKNYIRKIPMFATEIALMKNNELILGVSNAPAMNELLYAEKGNGAYFNDRKIRVSSRRNLKEGFMSFGGINYFEKLNLIENLLELGNSMQGKRGFGDFWGYHLLARGKIEIMVEADIKIWDIAALALIVEEAGGKVTDLTGGAVTKDTKTVLATNGFLHDEVLSFFMQ